MRALWEYQFYVGLTARNLLAGCNDVRKQEILDRSDTCHPRRCTRLWEGRRNERLRKDGFLTRVRKRTCVNHWRGLEGGAGGGVRSCVTSCSVAVFAGLLRIACCEPVFNERAKSHTRRLDHYRARGDKTIATRTLRAEARSQRPVFLELHSLAAGEINNYRGGREC